MSIPIVYYAFAQDMDSYLELLKAECKEIDKILRPLHDDGVFEIRNTPNTNVDDLIKIIGEYGDRLTIFHYAGHAGGDSLHLEGGTPGAAGLASLLGSLKNLKLVFLNGCSTSGQVDRLMKEGVKAVIATKIPVQDKKAQIFSSLFYDKLAGKGGIKEAYEYAVRAFNVKYSSDVAIEIIEYRGGFDFQQINELPWGLYINHNAKEVLEWNFLERPRRTFNELLTKQLIQALQPYSGKAREFLNRASKRAPDWETKTGICDVAKDIIISSFVGVLGVQLQNLISIGNEKEGQTDSQMPRYLNCCLLTAKRSLQLLCFAMISKLWDHSKEKNYPISLSQADTISDFFDTEFEMEIQDYFQLLRTIFSIFDEYKLKYPLLELTDFGESLDASSEFSKACTALQDTQDSFDRANLSMDTCLEAENKLVVILSALTFLANYKMVSIKKIAYDEMRNRPPYYLHSYTNLNISRSNTNIEIVKYAEEPFSTDAIFLFKERYEDSVNLFPFIIDMNALISESGVKIFFYKAKDIADGGLSYQFQEDDSIVENIVFRDTLDRTDGDMNRVLMDDKKRKQLKLDIVFTQFQTARNAILGQLE